MEYRLLDPITNRITVSKNVNYIVVKQISSNLKFASENDFETESQV